MENKQLVDHLTEGLAEIPLLDIHTHLDAAHLSARGLHDMLLYHMVISDLASAGCPSRGRLSEDPDEAEARRAAGRGDSLRAPTSATPAATGACGSSCATSMAATSRSAPTTGGDCTP